MKLQAAGGCSKVLSCCGLNNAALFSVCDWIEQ